MIKCELLYTFLIISAMEWWDMRSERKEESWEQVTKMFIYLFIILLFTVTQNKELLLL